MTICLNMIVKNEAHIIGTTLENILKFIPITYWVISDTGSTDETKTIIQDFFDKKKIPGELVEHEWKDFAYNRTKALECAFNKTDYLFIFDADDSIEGEGPLQFPPLKEDRYMFTFGKEFSYERPLLITNRKKWFYTGVLHEYLDSAEVRTATSIKGPFYVVSGRGGNRSKDPNKYLNDAIVLKNAYEVETRADLKARYTFYCGQSYMDAGMVDEAIEWYKKCESTPGWDQERYYSCIQLGELFRRKSDWHQMQHYWSKSCQYDTERIEGIAMLMEELKKLDNHVLVNAMYHKWRDYRHDLTNKLFIRNFCYDYEIEFLNSVSAYYAKDWETGYLCCKKVILHHKDKSKIDRSIQNLQFYKMYLHRDKKMIHHIKDKTTPEFFASLLKP
jgi:glycosyltransferase involved in cell wall biosynthesis